MKPIPMYLIAAAVGFGTVSLQAQSFDEERKARMEERRAKAGKAGKRRGEDKAPKVGTQAPDLGVRKRLDGKEINLSDPNRISVLVFGSHT